MWGENEKVGARVDQLWDGVLRGGRGGEMTERVEGSDAGSPAASATPGSVAAVADSSSWAPLVQRTFRWLWIGVLISYIGTWMQTVGAQ